MKQWECKQAESHTRLNMKSMLMAGVKTTTGSVLFSLMFSPSLPAGSPVQAAAATAEEEEEEGEEGGGSVMSSQSSCCGRPCTDTVGTRLGRHVAYL